jgi:hypothetical protein
MMTRFPPAIAFTLLLPAALCLDQPSFTVQGLGGKTVVVTGADLAGLPRHTIRTADHGKPATFEGVLLADVLAKVDLPVGDKYHSTAASYYVLAEGRDGYRAVYAWAEVDPAFMNKPVYVATRRDGQPLPGNAGPFQLVAPGEKRGGRWLRQLKTLTVKQAN